MPKSRCSTSSDDESIESCSNCRKRNYCRKCERSHNYCDRCYEKTKKNDCCNKCSKKESKSCEKQSNSCEKRPNSCNVSKKCGEDKVIVITIN